MYLYFSLASNNILGLIWVTNKTHQLTQLIHWLNNKSFIIQASACPIFAHIHSFSNQSNWFDCIGDRMELYGSWSPFVQTSLMNKLVGMSFKFTSNNILVLIWVTNKTHQLSQLIHSLNNKSFIIRVPVFSIFAHIHSFFNWSNLCDCFDSWSTFVQISLIFEIYIYILSPYFAALKIQRKVL